MAIATVDRTFEVVIEVHPAEWRCNGVVMPEPFGHGELYADVVASCLLDNSDVVVQSCDQEGKQLALTVWHSGIRGDSLSVGSVRHGDVWLRTGNAAPVPIERMNRMSDDPMARATVGLAVSFDLAACANDPGCLPLIIQFGITNPRW